MKLTEIDTALIPGNLNRSCRGWIAECDLVDSALSAGLTEAQSGAVPEHPTGQQKGERRGLSEGVARRKACLGWDGDRGARCWHGLAAVLNCSKIRRRRAAAVEITCYGQCRSPWEVLTHAPAYVILATTAAA